MLYFTSFLIADSFSSALQVESSKGEEEGGRENFLTSFLVATAKSSSMIVGLGGKISYTNVRVRLK